MASNLAGPLPVARVRQGVILEKGQSRGVARSDFRDGAVEGNEGEHKHEPVQWHFAVLCDFVGGQSRKKKLNESVLLVD
jgi:hypothetical protein